MKVTPAEAQAIEEELDLIDPWDRCAMRVALLTRLISEKWRRRVLMWRRISLGIALLMLGMLAVDVYFHYYWNAALNAVASASNFAAYWMSTRTLRKL